MNYFLIFGLILSSFVFAGILGDSTFAQLENQNTLKVSFENNEMPSYDILLNPEGKYVINQSYSWVKDESSRFNLVSYSIDGKQSIPIPRIPRGTFYLEIPSGSSQITFSAITQYPLTISGTNDYSFLPTSPTNDNWFDANSAISITIPTTSDIEKNKVRQIITGWALDKNQFRNLPDDESDFFITPPILMDNAHVIDFVSTTQYKLNILSEIGTTTGGGWYKQDDEVSISVDIPNEGLSMNVLSGWEGPVVESDGNSAKVIINGPTTIIAKWEQNSSLAIILVVVSTIVAVIIITKKFKRQSKKIESIEQPLVMETKVDSTPKKQYGENYDQELSEYFTQVVLEKLESIHASKFISDSKYSKIKKSL